MDRGQAGDTLKGISEPRFPLPGISMGACRAKVPCSRRSGAEQWCEDTENTVDGPPGSGRRPTGPHPDREGHRKHPQKTALGRGPRVRASRALRGQGNKQRSPPSGKAAACTLRGAPPRPLANSGNKQHPCPAFQPSPWTHVFRKATSPPAEGQCIQAHRVKQLRETTPSEPQGRQWLSGKYNRWARTDNSHMNSKYLQEHRRGSDK